MAYKRISPTPVVEGGTGAQTLTDHGVLVGSGTAAIDALAVGTTGQLLVGSTAADPAFGSSAAADFTFTTATAGTTRTLTVSNTDNTNTASNALLVVSSGGASGGDAFHQVSTTTTTWSFGVDNSVTSPTADPFVIAQGTALGTNNVMSVATSGEINYPLQPAFLALNSATDTDVTGNGTTYTYVCDSEIFDQNSDYNNATGVFTAPVTGRYMLSIGCTVTGNTIATLCQVTIVTSNRTYIHREQRPAGNAGFIVRYSQLCDMDAGDTAISQVMVSGEVADTSDVFGGAGDGGTTFAGYLAC